MSALFRTDMLSSQHRGRASISTLYLEQICEVASTRSKTLEDGLEIIIAFADNRGICFSSRFAICLVSPSPNLLALISQGLLWDLRSPSQALRISTATLYQASSTFDQEFTGSPLRGRARSPSKGASGQSVGRM